MAFFLFFVYWTPLHIASYKNYVNILKLLLKDKRTNVNATTPTGATALHLAATYASVDAVKLIIEHPKCNKYIENEQGKTPYDFAMQNNLSEKALLLRKIDEDDE